MLEALRKMEGDYSAFPVLESCHCADCAAMRERRQAVSQAVTIIEREAAARAEGEAAGRAALQVKLATAIQNCQLHRDDPEADESYFDGKERAYQNVLAWLREADRRPPIGPRG